MIGWLIAGAVLASIALLLSLRLHFLLRYDGEVTLKAGFACFRFSLLPNKRAKLNDPTLSPRKKRKLMQKLRAAEERSLAKKEKKEEKKRQKKAKQAAKDAKKKKKKSAAPEKAEPTKKKRSLKASLRLVIRLVKLLLDKFGKHLRIKVKKLRLTVATGDAASTALVYGGVSQSVAYLLALLNRFSRLKVKKNALAVGADFLSEKTTAEIQISLSVSLAGLLATALSAGWAFIRAVMADAKKAPAEPPAETPAAPAGTAVKKAGKRAPKPLRHP